MTNDERAEQARRLLEALDPNAGLEDNLIDALTNFRHLAKRAGLDFDKANEMARSHFLFEDECELMGVDEGGLWW